MQRDMRYCLELFQSSDRLIAIEKEVDPKFEIPAVMKEAERLGKAIIFKKVKGSEFTVVNNIFGSREMLALLFETRPEEVASEWLKRIKSPIEPTLVSSGPVKEVIKRGSEVDLEDLPIVTHCSKDAGPFITAGIVMAKDPETGIRNISINRMQFKGKNKLGIHYCSRHVNFR